MAIKNNPNSSDEIRHILGTLFQMSNARHITISSFWDLFLNSSLPRSFERGYFELKICKSPRDIFNELVTEAIVGVCDAKYDAYWLGSFIAAFQHKTNARYHDILRGIPESRIYDFCFEYRDHDEVDCFAAWTALHREFNPETNLKRLRRECCLTQHELSVLSGIPIRTIQQYEQRQKDINKAQSICLLSLATVLGCDMRSLMELIR